MGRLSRPRGLRISRLIRLRAVLAALLLIVCPQPRHSTYSPARFGNIPGVTLRLRVIHLFRKVLSILGAFQPAAWTVSERLHCSIFHKKNNSALVLGSLHLILAFFAKLIESENTHRLGRDQDRNCKTVTVEENGVTRTTRKCD